MAAVQHITLATMAQACPWYKVPLFVGVGLCGALAARHRRKLTLVILAISLSMMSYRLIRIDHREDRWAHTMPGAMLRMSRWINASAPDDIVIGSFNSGALGYMTERRVINLDGLANSRRYFDEVIRGGQLARYLRKENIHWIVDRLCPDGSSLRWYLHWLASESLSDNLIPIATPGLTPDPNRCPIRVLRVHIR